MEQTIVDISKTDLFVIWAVDVFEYNKDLVSKTAQALDVFAANAKWLIEPVYVLNAGQPVLTAELFNRWLEPFREEANDNFRSLLSRFC